MSSQTRQRKAVVNRWIGAAHILPILAASSSEAAQQNRGEGAVKNKWFSLEGGGGGSSLWGGGGSPWGKRPQVIYASSRSGQVASATEPWKSKEDWWKDPLAYFDDLEQEAQELLENCRMHPQVNYVSSRSPPVMARVAPPAADSWKSKEDWWKDPFAYFDDEEQNVEEEIVFDVAQEPDNNNNQASRKEENLEEIFFMEEMPVEGEDDSTEPIIFTAPGEVEGAEPDNFANIVMTPDEVSLDEPVVVESRPQSKVPKQNTMPEASHASEGESLTRNDIASPEISSNSAKDTEQAEIKNSENSSSANSDSTEPVVKSEVETTARISKPTDRSAGKRNGWGTRTRSHSRKAKTMPLPFESMTEVKFDASDDSTTSKALRIVSPHPPPDIPLLASVSGNGVSALVPKLLATLFGEIAGKYAVQSFAVIVIGKTLIDYLVQSNFWQSKVLKRRTVSPPRVPPAGSYTRQIKDDERTSLRYEVDDPLPELQRSAMFRQDFSSSHEEEEDTLDDEASETTVASATTETSINVVKEEPPTVSRFSFWGRRDRMPDARKTYEELQGLRKQWQDTLKEKASMEKEYETTSWQLKEAQTELSSLKQTTRYLQAQLRDQEEMLERVVQTERRRSKDELARMKEAMLQVIRQERESMREEFMKQAAEFQASWRNERQQQQQQQLPGRPSPGGNPSPFWTAKKGYINMTNQPDHQGPQQQQKQYRPSQLWDTKEGGEVGVLRQPPQPREKQPYEI